MSGRRRATPPATVGSRAADAFMIEPAPARPASTVLLIRDGASGLEVFMVKRHRQIDFASGALVFPGGSLDPGDWLIDAYGDFEARERAMRVAAVRETFEEAGVLLARPKGGLVWIDGARTEDLVIAAKGKSFGELVAAENLELGLDALVPFAHWVTPKALPKRFDTKFYIVAAPADQLAGHDGWEAVESLWINPAAALEAADNGVYTLIAPTRLNIELLGQSLDVASALAAARARKIVTVEPRGEKTETGFRMHIPLEAGYGVDGFSIVGGSV